MQECVDSLKFLEFYRLLDEEQLLFTNDVTDMNIKLEKKLRDEAEVELEERLPPFLPLSQINNTPPEYAETNNNTLRNSQPQQFPFFIITSLQRVVRK